MATLPTQQAHELRTDLYALPGDVARGVCPSRVVAAQNTWTVWTTFCRSLNIDPGLGGITNPLPVLLIFARRYRDGRLAPAGHPVLAHTAEDAVRQVGQAFAVLGLRDPRLNELGRLDFRLTRIVNGWKPLDTPTKRKRPVPKQVRHYIPRGPSPRDG